MTWAWSTSLLSKIATIGVQVLAVPLVYRALGEGGYAAYAAVTASAGLIGVLNLGIGGSLVTPIAEAAARQDERRQAVLVQAGLGPLVLLCIFGSALVIPAVALLPLRTLFGKVGATGSWDLRIAALIAVSATLATIPLSAAGFLRQAYQEMHLSNLIGAASNVLLCIALLIAAARSTMVAVFVAVFVLIPLIAQGVNFAWLLAQRPFLLRSEGRRTWKDSRHLLADGIRFLGASFASVLVYQWPVYWIARSLPASSSSLFAICIQATVLPLGFVFGFLQPLWSATADALARADHQWLDSQIKRGRSVIVAVGGCAFLMLLFFGEKLIHLWLRKPITLNWTVRGLMGAYILLALWEYFHFTMALGFGHLREAASAIFQRSISFAIAVPLLTKIGGVSALWFGLCCSILFWTAWRLPRLLHDQYHEVMGSNRA
jgi:O-antigen/teichoic acid export membrane protein